MKKSLLAFAVLGACVSIASAQSSVSISGTLDVNAKYVKNDGSERRLSLDGNDLNTSQLVFQGVEDLGDGLKAGFTLNSALFPDTGTTNATKFFNRRSTVSLLGNWGEIRAGRDYVPTYRTQYTYDVMGDNGVGATTATAQLTHGTYFRADNAIQYFLPSTGIGGLYGLVMVAAGEGAATNPGRYVGGRLGWTNGPFDVSGAYGSQRLDLTPTSPSHKTANIGASYDFTVVKLMGFYDHEAVSFPGSDKKEDRVNVSLLIPIGLAQIHLAYDTSKLEVNGNSTRVDLFGIRGVYNLSKRTALYAAAARLNNKDGTHLTVAGGTAQTAAPTGPAGGSFKSTGFDVGIRHFF